MYYYVETRQQFIIPPTPIQTFPSSGLDAVENDGTPIPSETTESGDSFYITFWLSGGGSEWNFRFLINTAYLDKATDYYVCTASLNDIPGELVLQITKFLNLIPYPSWRLRVDLTKYPYTTFAVAPISQEGDITQVAFTETLDWTGTIFGVAPLGRHYWFCSLKGFGVTQFPFYFPWESADKILHQITPFSLV